MRAAWVSMARLLALVLVSALALQLFFVALSQLRGGWLPVKAFEELDPDELAKHELSASDMFNYAEPFAIVMAVRLAIDPKEMKAEGIPPTLDPSDLYVALNLQRGGKDEHGRDCVEMLVKSFRFADGTEITQEQDSVDRKPFLAQLIRYLAQAVLGQRQLPRLGIDRRLSAVVDALYDSQASDRRVQAMQWERFEKSMSSFEDVLGPGRFVAVLPRGEETARLLFETTTMRVPVEALGTGVQQLVALVGGLLTTGASVVFIEEPEAHLRWTTQERLHEVLKDLVGKEGAPSQLIMASHSATFETRDTFYLMQRGDKGPTLTLRPIGELSMLVGDGKAALATGDPTEPPIPTYATSEGILRLPSRIRKAMHVEHGGGVSFMDKGGGVVEMMSDDTFLQHVGATDDDDVAQ